MKITEKNRSFDKSPLDGNLGIFKNTYLNQQVALRVGSEEATDINIKDVQCLHLFQHI